MFREGDPVMVTERNGLIRYGEVFSTGRTMDGRQILGVDYGMQTAILIVPDPNEEIRVEKMTRSAA